MWMLKMQNDKRWGFILILCGLLFIYGGNVMAKWEIEGKIPKLHKANAIWFNKDVGLFFGHYRPLDVLLTKDIKKNISMKEAIVLRKDKDSDGWEKVYSGKGEILSADWIERSVFYAFGKKYFLNEKTESFLLRSNDLGKTWIDVSLAGYNFDGIAFFNEMQGYAYNENEIYYTESGGISWYKVNKPFSIHKGGPFPVVDQKSRLWGYESKNIFCIDKFSQVIVESLPFDVRIDSLAISKNNSIWIIGRNIKTAEVEIIKRDRCNNYKKIACLPYFLPIKMFISNTTIVIMGAEIKNGISSKIIYISKDMGHSWEKIRPKIEYIDAATYLEGDHIIWSIGTQDRIQKYIIR